MPEDKQEIKNQLEVIKQRLKPLDNPNRAIFDEIQHLSGLVNRLIETTQGNRVEEVTVANLSDIRETDISPLGQSIKELEKPLQEVVKAVQNTPKVDLSIVETLLGNINTKEVKDIDLSELKEVKSTLENILFAIQNMVERPETESETLLPELQKINETLFILNENLRELDIPEVDYDRLALIIKKNLRINVSGGGGGGGSTTITGDVSTTPLKQTQTFEYSGGLLIYQGIAEPGASKSAAVWRIAKFTYSGTDLIEQQWADGNILYDNVWDDRVSLSYS